MTSIPRSSSRRRSRLNGIKIFEQQPKSHQRKYAAEHEEVEKDEDQLRVFFNGCHASNRSDGMYAKVLKSTLEARKAKDLREKGLAVERKPTASRRYQGTFLE